MSLLPAILIGLAMGVVFGLALEKSRVFEPGIIVGQMQLKTFIMLKVFLSAVAVGAISLAILDGLDIIELHPKPAAYGADILGGLLLGVGIALAGACPGTVLAQIGAGYRDALFVLAGGLAGATAYAYAQPSFSDTILRESGEKILFSDLAGVPYWAGALTLAALCVIALLALETWRPWRSEVGAELDGRL